MLYRETRLLGFLMVLGAAGLVVAADAEQRIPTPRDAAGDVLTVHADGISAAEQSLINRADAGRQEVESRATELVREANAFLADGEYIKARDKYLEAVKLFRSYNTPVFQDKMEHCQRQIGLCYYYMAEEAMDQADRQAQAQDFEAAINLCKEAQKYYPEGADELQRKIEIYERKQAAAAMRADAAPEKLLPNLKTQEYQIEVLLQQGRELANVREYTKALRKFQEVLLIDPYNADALQNMKAMNVRIGKVGKDRYNVTHRKMIAEVEWKFAIPIIPEGEESLSENFIENEPQKKAEPEESPLLKKLNSIIIPNIDFEEVTVPAALKSLIKQSRELDPEQVGINIFLRRSDNSAVQENQRNMGYPGADMMMGPQGMPQGAYPQGMPQAMGPQGGMMGEGDEELEYDEEGNPIKKEQLITLLINNTSLMDAIIKLCATAKLKYRVEKYAVILAPQDVALDEMETRIFPVEQQALSSSLDGDISDPNNLIRFFNGNGIDFPSGSQIIYDPMISRLIVTNTPENLNSINQVITDYLEQQEPMVQIIAKFIEISQTDLKELAFNYQYAVNAARETTGNNVTSASKIDASSNELMRYYRDEQATTTRDPLSEGTFSFVWEDTDGTRFTASMFALNWADSEDVLASPRVTTLPGQSAHVAMVTERYFPDEWETVDLPENNAGSDGDANATTTSWRGTRADPQPTFESDPTPLGITFDITPEVDVERRTITAQVILPIQTLSGWMEFDARTVDSSGDTDGEYYKMPIFDRREINTTVTVYDGETVVLGGVASDTTEIVNDKIPILGDLPVIGRFFQSKYTDAEKRNLLVFLTCRLVKPDGSAFFPAEERSRGVPDFGRNR